MSIKSMIAAAGLLAMVPVAAGALSVTLLEGAGSSTVSGSISDGAAEDVDPNDGSLNFFFNTGNFSGEISALSSNVNGVVTFSIIGSATALTAEASTLPLTFLASDSFSSPFDPLTVKIAGESAGTGDSSLSIAAFLSASNNGGAGDATDVTTAVTGATLVAAGATDSAVNGTSFLATNRIAITPNDPFALNQLIVINQTGGLDIGDTTTFTLSGVATVPVPAPAILLLSALGGLGFFARSRRRAKA